MRKLPIALPVVLAFAIVTVSAQFTPGELLGTAEPENEGSGWDQNPTSGDWGGRGADGTFAVAWAPSSPDEPALNGRWAEVTIPGVRGKVPARITVKYLAGMANDDYCVLVRMGEGLNYLALGCQDDDEADPGENWVNRFFVLPTNMFSPGQDVTVQIRVTGNAWSQKETYGQLAVDSVSVWSAPSFTP